MTEKTKNLNINETEIHLIKEEESNENFLVEEDEGQLAIDAYQTPTEIFIEAPIAGVKPEDLDIFITAESVTIKGKRSKERKVAEEDFLIEECYWGKFSRSINLPQEIEVDKSTANLKEGILTIRLPKLNRQKAKKLKIKIES